MNDTYCLVEQAEPAVNECQNQLGPLEGCSEITTVIAKMFTQAACEIHVCVFEWRHG